MGNQAEKTEKRRVCAGLLAHVDAGKTTLAEGILYLTGRIRSLGRVDHQDAFFDTFAIERERGITVFSKQAQIVLKGVGREEQVTEGTPLSVTLLDTPGHVDFSAEMERTLQVLDYAILVISGSDGVQSHVETLWRLLTRYEIPVFLFVNKMDQPGTDRAALLAELNRKLDDRCIDFTLPYDSEEFQENLAMCDEELLESYLSGEPIGTEAIADLIAERKVFPCYFGSALKLQGVEELLDGLRVFCVPKNYPEEFGARVYKISRDAQGNRLTHMKITGGTLHVRDVLTTRKDVYSRENASRWDGDKETPPHMRSGAGSTLRFGRCLTSATGAQHRAVHLKNASRWDGAEKINQIRVYSGEGYETAGEAAAGTVCAVTGPEHTYAGEGLGIEPEAELPVLEPVLSYRIELPEGTDVHQAFRQLRQLEEEEPQLRITWMAGGAKTGAAGPEGANTGGYGSGGRVTDGAGMGETNSGAGEIHAQLMGEVQTEILQQIILERFGLKVRFGEGSIVYRETIAAPVVGMGHFEPLRHYAEVHLLMEPAERGSGLQFESSCSLDELDGNWQRLVLSHLEEKSYPGVLTGSEITDMKITLVAGRAHQKHTEGGDFRQATYRAVRQGLCRARSVLLEPVYRFRLEVPTESVGRALSDIQRMYGSTEPPVPVTSGSDNAYDMMLIEGTAPVVTMRGYQSEVLSYTKGRGRLSCQLEGYEECHNTQDVIEAYAYDAQSDLENPCGSVFCAHGAGFVVNWEDVPDYVHIQDTDAYAEAALARMRGEEQNGGETAESTVHLENASRWDGAREAPPHVRSASGASAAAAIAEDNELRAIFERTYGTAERWRNRSPHGKNGKEEKASGQRPSAAGKKAEALEECLLVDGYNIIFAWDELKELAKMNLESARGRLLDLMSNYQGYKQNHLIVVFDAYRVSGHNTEVSRYHNIYVVFTKEAETADQYIEKTVREINRKYHVTVATSDALEQVIIFGAGASRLSARGLYEELELMRKDLKENYLERQTKSGKTYLLDGKEPIDVGWTEEEQ